jgi:CRP/FNR family transcriptional regulator
MDSNLWVSKTVDRGQILFLEGDQGDNIYCIKEGAIKVFVLTPNGKEKILALLGPGDFLGEMALIDEKPRSATAQALENSRVMVLNKASFCAQIKENPLIAYQLIQMLVARLRHTDEQLMSQVSKTARNRVGQGILDLVDKFGANTPEGLSITLRITHQDLAAYSGVARETATRVLQDFVNEGLLMINAKNRILIPNVEKFKKVVSN